MRTPRLLLLLLLLLPLRAEDFGPEDFRARREELAKQVGAGFVVLECREIPRDPKVDKIDERTGWLDFPYLTGNETKGAILVLLPAVHGEYLFLPEGQDREKVKQSSGVANVLALEAFPQFVHDVLEGGKEVWLKKKEGIRKRLELDLAGAEFHELSGATTALRVVKSPREQRILGEAARISCDGIVKGMKAAHPGMNESELREAIEGTFRAEGAERLAFPSIIGSGINSTSIHYTEDKRQMEMGDLVVTDVGAELHGYAGDVTRTYAVNGKFTPEQREVYEIVREAQEEVRKQLKPGITLLQMDGIARRYIEKKGYGKYFTHYVGHYVGLNVHDSGSFAAPLGAGMEVTIEPGIYIAEKKIGVRIEDDYLVTEEGCRCLSDGAPRTIDEIEALMKK